MVIPGTSGGKELLASHSFYLFHNPSARCRKVMGFNLNVRCAFAQTAKAGNQSEDLTIDAKVIRELLGKATERNVFLLPTSASSRQMAPRS